MLGDGGSAARTPFGGAVALVQPPPLVHELQEPPDVLDVRVAEGEVVGSPVHPLPEALRSLCQLGRRPDHLLAAAARELREPELLDLALRVEAELPLDPDLDPQALAVEAVLVALVMTAQRLVPLEDVFQRPPPRRVHGERLVGRYRTVDEAEPRSLRVLLAEPAEGLLALPTIQHLPLERVMIRLVRQRCEHAVDSREGFSGVRRLGR
jgi:hypothetical protein